MVDHVIDVVVVVEQDAKFTKKENGQEWGDNRGEEPEGFEWQANGIGRITVTPHVTDLDFTVDGYRFKAHLTNEVLVIRSHVCNSILVVKSCCIYFIQSRISSVFVAYSSQCNDFAMFDLTLNVSSNIPRFFLLLQLLWDAHKSERGPEGWARYVKIAPTHWYVYSLGSSVEYSFSNPDKGIHSEGSAFGHVEKNWGQTFPAGHVWMQAFSADNTSQVTQILQRLTILLFNFFLSESDSAYFHVKVDHLLRQVILSPQSAQKM